MERIAEFEEILPIINMCLYLHYCVLVFASSYSISQSRTSSSNGSKGQGTGLGIGFLGYFHTWLRNYLFMYQTSIYSLQTSSLHDRRGKRLRRMYRKMFERIFPSMCLFQRFFLHTCHWRWKRRSACT